MPLMKKRSLHFEHITVLYGIEHGDAATVKRHTIMNTHEDRADWEIGAKTVAQVFANAVRQAPDTIFCKTAEISLTYEQAAGAVQTLADELRPTVEGQQVAVILPNSIAFLVTYFAILFAGGKPALLMG